MNWKNIIEEEQKQPYFKSLQKRLDEEYKHKSIYPPRDMIYRAFELTHYSTLKVVIIGQDPYHKANQAQGLAFSTPKEVKNPPSLVNILKEIESDLGNPSQNIDGDLTSWAKQGVLLINSLLTVEETKPKSHQKIGWEIFTDKIIEHISSEFENIVFILWGGDAISKGRVIDSQKHHILSSPHPSPLSSYRGFFGSKCFSKTNEILVGLDKEPIVW